MDSNEPFNYLTAENGVVVTQCSSQISNCPVKNILVSEKRAIWLSDQGLPQSIVLNLSHQNKRPRFYKCFGFDCWHDYPSNPSVIELLVSIDGENFIIWTAIHAELRAGVQLFQIDPIGNKYNYLKIVIKETFGASKTYLNQVFLFEENPLNNFQMNTGLTERPNLSTSNVNIQSNTKDNLLDAYIRNASPMNINRDMSGAPKRRSIGNHTAPGPYRSGHKQSFSQVPQYAQTEEKNQDNLVPESRTRRDNVHVSMMSQPNFENQTGSFFSPTPDHYLSHPNLSLLQETASKDQVDYTDVQSKMVQPYFDNGSVKSPHSNTLVEKSSNFMNQRRVTPNKENINTPSPHVKTQQQTKNNGTLHGGMLSFANKQGDPNPFLSDKLLSLNNDVKKLMKQPERTNENETVEIQKLKSNSDIEDVDIPFLTHSEKEVRRMKQEMTKWGSTIQTLQDNMSQLLDKVSVLNENIEHKKNGEKSQHQSSSKYEKDERFKNERVRQSSQSLDGGQPIANYLEDFKREIASYLENVTSQNQTIIEENQKLRQNFENLIQTHSTTGRGQHEIHMSTVDPGYFSGGPISDSRDLEKIVSNLFEKNIRSWENIFYQQMKTQNELLEDRINHKLNNAIENIKDREQHFKEKILTEISHLQNKSMTPKKENILESKTSPKRFAKDRSSIIKEQSAYSFQNEPIENTKNNNFKNRGNISFEETRRGVTYTHESQQSNHRVNSPKDTLRNSANNFEKVQYLMSRLQEKIAIRDKKVQELQKEFSPLSSISYAQDLRASRSPQTRGERHIVPNYR